MKHYEVSTHVGTFSTCATSEKKAIANVRYRLYGRGFPVSVSWSWTAKQI